MLDKNEIKYPKFLAEANSLLRDGRFDEAIVIYELIISHHPFLYKTISYNINFARRKIAKSGQSSTVKIQLVCPDFLDRYYFDLIQEHELFHPSWYLSKYGQKYDITYNPLEHYLLVGVKSGLNPSIKFDTDFYLNTYQDVKLSGENPFLHYVTQGIVEGRNPLPQTQSEYEAKYIVKESVYVPRLSSNFQSIETAVRVIAFYLPQFHPIPENNEWWGDGFTEWTNVRPAKPQFENHYQPHIPDNTLGYYDLLDGVTQAKQVELAKQYGVNGFCFYIYWFSGHRLLEKPVENYLNNKTLDLPFCVCWANENWSRRWDGLDHDILMQQYYSPQDDINFISSISKYFLDSRYIRINGRPLLLVYRPNLFPDMKKTSDRWRQWCVENGIGNIYLAYPQSFECVNPVEYGFDAACEFPPNNSSPPNITNKVVPKCIDFKSEVYDWRIFVDRSEAYKNFEYTLFRGVVPSWDNTARKKNKGIVFQNSSPLLFEQWLINAFTNTKLNIINQDERIVFVNAWNEWAEGAHLEPDSLYGFAWLNAIRNAHIKSNEIDSIRIALVVHVFYLDVFSQMIDRIKKINMSGIKLFVTTNSLISNEVHRLLLILGIDFHIEIYNNHGRDVLPFLKVSKIIIDQGYDFIIKTHTKKSTHRNDGDIWRESIFNELFCEQFIKNAVISMELNNNVGIVSPTDQIVPMHYYWGSNADTVTNLSSRIGVTNSELDKLTFVAGTMFIARSSVIKGVLDIGLMDNDFEVEEGQIDGTMAHAIERFFGVMCYHKNMQIIAMGSGRVNLSFSHADIG
jgi:lipopolysaccharide biosynthesis protein